MKLLLGTFLIALLISTDGNAQNQLPESHVVRANKVKGLTVINCLKSSSCFEDNYRFNSCGEVAVEMPARIGFYMKYDYNEHCGLKTRWIMNYSSKLDSVWQKIEISPLGLDSLIGIRHAFDFDQPERIDTIRYARNQHEPKNKKYDKEGHLLQHDWGDLHYPCGIDYSGPHIIKYKFDAKGLITHAVAYNEKNEVVVDLEYIYKY
jgi:hypothetical protein